MIGSKLQNEYGSEARGLNPWRRPEGSCALGTGMKILVSDIKGEDVPRTISETLHRRCLRSTNQAKNGQKLRNKKKNGTSRRNVNCSRLQPPSVEKLIFTRDDVWRVKNEVSRLTQAKTECE